MRVPVLIVRACFLLAANMRTQAREIFGDELADRVGDIWGYGEFVPVDGHLIMGHLWHSILFTNHIGHLQMPKVK